MRKIMTCLVAATAGYLGVSYWESRSAIANTYKRRNPRLNRVGGSDAALWAAGAAALLAYNWRSIPSVLWQRRKPLVLLGLVLGWLAFDSTAEGIEGFERTMSSTSMGEAPMCQAAASLHRPSRGSVAFGIDPRRDWPGGAW